MQQAQQRRNGMRAFMIDFSKIQSYKENNRIEAKRATGGFPGSLWETYSAFANTYGGIIMLGVEEMPDKFLRTVKLPDPDRLVEIFWQSAADRQKISANILCAQDIQIVEAGGNRIVAIEVPRANRRDKPVYLGTDPYTGSYRRNGEGDYRCTRAEVDAMLRDRCDVSKDSEILIQFTSDCFDKDSVSWFRRKSQQRMPLPESIEDFLRDVGAAAVGKDQELHPTIGGLLMMGRQECIQNEFPNLQLEYYEQTERYALPFRYTGKNLFDFYETITSRLQKRQYAAWYGIHMDDEILQAVSEALANALMHADYFASAGVRMEMTPEAVRITNPGGMRICGEDAFQDGLSDPRNMTLIHLFHLIQVGNRSGSGLRKIRSAWKRHGWRVPELRESFGPDKTILLLPFSVEERNGGSEENPYREREEYERKKLAVLEYLTFYVTGTAEELAKAFGISKFAVEKVLSAMKEEGIIEKSVPEAGKTAYQLTS